MIQINMNESCKVKLTKFGLAVLERHYLKHRQLHEVKETIKIIHKPDFTGYYNFQLWELMQVFGPSFGMGMREVPFEENNICFN